jgi:hypothetical protein
MANINNIHRDKTDKSMADLILAEIRMEQSPLKHIIKSESNTTFFVNSPRVGYFQPTTCAKFLEGFSKRENITPQSERISKDEKTGIVKVWIRSYSQYTYMVETDESNLV